MQKPADGYTLALPLLHQELQPRRVPRPQKHEHRRRVHEQRHNRPGGLRRQDPPHDQDPHHGSAEPEDGHVAFGNHVRDIVHHGRFEVLYGHRSPRFIRVAQILPEEVHPQELPDVEGDLEHLHLEVIGTCQDEVRENQQGGQQRRCPFSLIGHAELGDLRNEEGEVVGGGRLVNRQARVHQVHFQEVHPKVVQVVQQAQDQGKDRLPSDRRNVLEAEADEGPKQREPHFVQRLVGGSLQGCLERVGREDVVVKDVHAASQELLRQHAARGVLQDHREVDGGVEDVVVDDWDADSLGVLARSEQKLALRVLVLDARQRRPRLGPVVTRAAALQAAEAEDQDLRETAGLLAIEALRGESDHFRDPARRQHTRGR
mmetsp:Transcript_92119/g.281946  ORF Transcript_92119/g.281946 Transcript_92119/m.281946 type:complete len:373 (+) Transcript_92119:1364-2482(+)